MYIRLLLIISCFQCSKDTKMRANHNKTALGTKTEIVVSNVPKILKWEQITTAENQPASEPSCFQCSKDTKMRANHNHILVLVLRPSVVSNVPKILKWEQITTAGGDATYKLRCFQCSKDTKMRANHNGSICSTGWNMVVSNVPKILKWEQITTTEDIARSEQMLFPMFQRY